MKKVLDYTISEEQMRELDEHELAELLMYADRDRKGLEAAETIYWLCVREINRRLDDGETTLYLN